MSTHRRSLDDAGLLHTATSAGSGAAFPTAASLGSLGRSASVSNPFDVTELLARISLLPPTPPPPPALDSASSGGGPRCLSTDGVNRVQWVQPSGEAALLLLANGCLPGSIVASSKMWGKKWELWRPGECGASFCWLPCAVAEPVTLQHWSHRLPAFLQGPGAWVREWRTWSRAWCWRSRRPQGASFGHGGWMGAWGPMGHGRHGLELDAWLGRHDMLSWIRGIGTQALHPNPKDCSHCTRLLCHCPLPAFPCAGEPC